MNGFIASKRYTFKRNNDAFKTATIYRNGEKHSIKPAANAQEFCWKWNGNRDECEETAR